MPFLTIARDGAILTVTMNQPETRNALTGNTAVDEFVQLCQDVQRDASVKAIILTGASADGAAGQARVRQLGGAAWVQEPTRASCGIMPAAALKLAGADRVLDLPQMAASLALLGDGEHK